MNDSIIGGLRVAVVGGGITGLAAAHRLHELDTRIAVTLFEAASRLGGVLETIRREDFLIEGGADNFITQVPWATDLCRRIGFEDQLVETRAGNRQAFVVSSGRLRKIPEGFVVMAPGRIWPIVSTRILSPLGKLRMAAEYFVRKRADEADESLASFVTRRFGRETYTRLVQPLIGGIYTGDPEKLSLRSTMPRFLEMECKHGSLIRAVLSQGKKKEQTRDRKSGGGRYSMFVAPRDGISSMVDALAARLPASTVTLNAPVARLARDQAGWSVTIGSQEPEPRHFDAVILATPAPATARLVEPLDGHMAEQLKGIHYAGCTLVSLAYRREEVGHALDGFGFVVPHIENRRILSGSFASVKYPGRAPEDTVLMRVYIGGALQAQLADLPDDQLVAIAREELGELVQARGEPLLTQINRRPHAMPQYYVGHADLVAGIESRTTRLPGLYLAGNAYHGVGIPMCIRSGEQAAEEAYRRSQENES